MKSKRIFAIVLAFVLTFAMMPVAFAQGSSIQVWVSQVNDQDTGMAKGLSKENNISFSIDDESGISNLVIVDESKEYQQMDGFGASITEASAHLYQNVLDVDQREAVMNALFR